ncbi:MAG: hypothetical protein HZC29_05200 [Thaumarchaeota archaeon]|nr:hypothetical protein [Nitrososphaerota archaeon]
MTAASHATLKSMKFFLNEAQENNTLDDRLKAFLSPADEWLERGLRRVKPLPISVTPDTVAVASQYAAGLWEQINQLDKTKNPANITAAERELQKMIDAPFVDGMTSFVAADDPRDAKMTLPTQSSIFAFDNFA